ncbi:MAG: hydrogen gas-evolving membrane-bound hydrogenase subunit E [Chlamydiota bacterium]
MIGLYILLVLMIVAAVAAVEMRDLLASVVAVGAVGLALSVAFLILGAPDLAIAQLVVEIICLVILVRATVSRDRVDAWGARADMAAAGAVVFAAGFLFLARLALGGIPSFGAPLMRVGRMYLEEVLVRTSGGLSVVGAIIGDYRAYDTLGEATILFASVIGVLALLRRIGRKDHGRTGGER